MKYEYKTIRYIPYVGRSGACTLSYEEFDDYGLFAWQILEQGRLGWKVVASGCNSDGEITTVIMERISGQNETQKGRAKLARYIAPANLRREVGGDGYNAQAQCQCVRLGYGDGCHCGGGAFEHERGRRRAMSKDILDACCGGRMMWCQKTTRAFSRRIYALKKSHLQTGKRREAYL